MSNSKLCKHLKPIEEELRKNNPKVSLYQFKNWTDEKGYTGYSIYFECVLDRFKLKCLNQIPQHIIYQHYGVAAQYAGFFCRRCQCSISGYHPAYQENFRRDVNRKKGPFI